MNEAIQTTKGLGLIFLHSSLDDAGLTPSEFRVLAHLSRRAGDGKAWPGIDSMAKVCRLSLRTVISAIKTLECKRMIIAKRKPGLNTVYWLTPHDEWVKPPVQNAQRHPCKIDNGVVQNEQRHPCKIDNERLSNKGNPLKDGVERFAFLNLLSPKFNCPEFVKAIDDWISHRKQIKQKLTPKTIELQSNRFAMWGVQKSVESINFAIEQGWHGVYEKQEKYGHTGASVGGRRVDGNAGTLNDGKSSQYRGVGKVV